MSVFSNTKLIEPFLRKLRIEGFTEIEARDIEKTLKRLKIKVARNKHLERTFVFSNGQNYFVIIRTTIDHATGKLIPSGKDSAWVLITQGDGKRISTPPIKRTSNFYSTLFFFSRVFKQILHVRPLCDNDDNLMNLETVEERRKAGEFLPHKWVCSHCGAEKDNLRDQLLGVLSNSEAKLLEERYNARSRYNSKRIDEEKEPHGTWGKNRTKHVIQNPQNLI